jgi:hypothetical protein
LHLCNLLAVSCQKQGARLDTAFQFWIQKAQHGIHRRAGTIRARSRRLSPFDTVAIAEDVIEVMTTYPKDLASLTI